MENYRPIIGNRDKILLTGSAGFIGKRVLATLLEYGFTNIRCLVRPSARPVQICSLLGKQSCEARVEIFEGNLLSRADCLEIARDAQVIYHLAAGRGEKLYADAFLNSVVITRNLLDACLQHGTLKRFVNVSSLTVYTNRNKPLGRLLDETCPIEREPAKRKDPYCFAKVKQEEMLIEYSKKHALPHVILRPGVVYGPGNEKIHGRVGIDTFGVFLHLGGSNKVPLSYVDNCADAIVLAGITPGIDGEAFNIVDDALPSSQLLLRLYKEQVKQFRSIYIPSFLSYILCFMWEKYCAWSHGQLPETFNRRAWHVYWKSTLYTNEKLKRRLGWSQRVATSDGLKRYFESGRKKERHA
jgi:nucleoside-diphosphate-sugar epimerase